MKIQAVIFDMDGVLLDSEPFYYEYLTSRFRELNLEVSDEEYSTFVGLSSPGVWKKIEESRDISLDIDGLVQTEEEQINNIFEEAILEPTPGIIDLLEKLRELNIPLSVASSSAKSTIELIIKKLGFNEYFRFLVSGNEVNKGKPHPDIFLRTAELLKADPQKCMVIEDSRNGIIGARKAGMICVGFKNLNSGKQDLSDADLIIEDFGKGSIQSILRLL